MEDLPELEDASPDEVPQRVEFDRLLHPEKNKFQHDTKSYSVVPNDFNEVTDPIGYIHEPLDFCGLDEGKCKHGGKGMDFHMTAEGWFVHTGCGYPTQRWFSEYWDKIVRKEP